MNNKKQSSVEWFIAEFQKQIEFVPNSELDIWFKDLFPKAKAMHKQEIIDAFRSGLKSPYYKDYHWEPQQNTGTKSEHYYKETFEK